MELDLVRLRIASKLRECRSARARIHKLRTGGPYIRSALGYSCDPREELRAHQRDLLSYRANRIGGAA